MISICGESIENDVDGNGVSVKNFGESTSKDMIDYVKPFARKKPDKIIIHVSTNYISKGIANTNENVKSIVETIHEISPDTKVYFSEILMRTDLDGSFS